MCSSTTPFTSVCHPYFLYLKTFWIHALYGKCKVIPLQARCGPERVGRGIALLFHDRGTRRGWVVSSTPRPHFTPGKDPVPIVQEAGWAPGPVWTGGKSRPHRDSIPDRPARSQSLYRLSYPAHVRVICGKIFVRTGVIKLYDAMSNTVTQTFCNAMASGLPTLGFTTPSP